MEKWKEFYFLPNKTDRFCAALESRNHSSLHFLAEPCSLVELSCFNNEGFDPDLLWCLEIKFALAYFSSSMLAQNAFSVKLLTRITLSVLFDRWLSISSFFSCPAWWRYPPLGTFELEELKLMEEVEERELREHLFGTNASQSLGQKMPAL